MFVCFACFLICFRFSEHSGFTVQFTGASHTQLWVRFCKYSLINAHTYRSKYCTCGCRLRQRLDLSFTFLSPVFLVTGEQLSKQLGHFYSCHLSHFLFIPCCLSSDLVVQQFSAAGVSVLSVSSALYWFLETLLLLSFFFFNNDFLLFFKSLYLYPN